MASTTVTSRIVFALARDDALPLSSWIKPVYSGTHIPARSIAVVFIVDGTLPWSTSVPARSIAVVSTADRML